MFRFSFGRHWGAGVPQGQDPRRERELVVVEPKPLTHVLLVRDDHDMVVGPV